MKKTNVELLVGVFVLLGIASLAWLSIELGNVGLFGPQTYSVYAEFSNVGAIRNGSEVEIAGVPVGTVETVSLAKGYLARVVMSVQRDVKIQEDAIASIKTKGLIGEAFIELSPGASEQHVEPGGRIRETESAVNLTDLISKYAFGSL
ncbi:MAG: outer membrane lipid asymmetry maintenance protein MlaD [Nitrospirota bacterium]|jgi:phospholipid/cholesterol/gamma-HCH transport system substrate-binding protein